MHGIASLCLAAFVTAALPPHLRKPVPPVIVLLFGFSFFIPVLGLLGQIVALLVAKYLPRIVPELPYAEMPPIEFEFPPREMRERTKYGPGGLTSRLKDAGVPKETRFKSLLALQGMPPRIANPLLQDMLGDPADEMRLVAYGMLDNQEKNINQHIHDELEKLHDADSPDMELISLRRLAELYWELVYGGPRARRRARPRDGRNRPLSRPGDARRARRCGPVVSQRQDLAHEARPRGRGGFPPRGRERPRGIARAFAYFAQIAFERRDYLEVRRVFSSARKQKPENLNTLVN